MPCGCLWVFWVAFFSFSISLTAYQIQKHYKSVTCISVAFKDRIMSLQIIYDVPVLCLWCLRYLLVLSSPFRVVTMVLHKSLVTRYRPQGGLQLYYINPSLPASSLGAGNNGTTLNHYCPLLGEIQISSVFDPLLPATQKWLILWYLDRSEVCYTQEPLALEVLGYTTLFYSKNRFPNDW
jgi:hypothetical protein